MLEPAAWSGIPSGRTDPDRGEGPTSVSAASVAAFLRRYLWGIVAWTAAGIALAAAYAFTATPHYTAESRLVISPQMPASIRERNIEGSFTLDNAQIESHIAVLRSEKIAAMVVAKLDLENDPDFLPKPGRSARLLGLFVTQPPPAPPTPFERYRSVMETFQGGLQVRRVGLSYAIDVSFRSPDPRRAAQIASATVDAYIRDQLEAKSDTARIGSEWLEGRLAQLRAQMNAAAQEAQEFRSRHDYRIPSQTSSSQPTEREGSGGGDATAPRRSRNSLNELDTTAETYRRLYESFLQSYTESVQRQSFPVPDARVVTEATMPLEQSDPKVKLVLALGGLLGGLVGFGVALGRHNLDTRVWSAHQIREDVGLECLACLPRISPWDARRSRRIAHRIVGAIGDEVGGQVGGQAGGAVGGMIGGAVGAKRVPARAGRRDGYVDAATSAPLAPFGAALMGLRARIGLGVGRSPIRSVGLASMNDGEGKSTLAGNLAALCARTGARTLLVDADLRAGSLSRSLAPGIGRRLRPGLIEVLEATSTLDDALVRDVGHDLGRNLDFLPNGCLRSPVANEYVLGSEAMRVLLEEIDGRYDLVVFDLPSLKHSASALTLGTLVESVVLVTECGRTSAELACEGAYWLQTVQARLLGAVITKVEA